MKGRFRMGLKILQIYADIKPKEQVDDIAENRHSRTASKEGKYETGNIKVSVFFGLSNFYLFF